MSNSQGAYLQALSDLPQAVFVLTTFRDDGSPHGFTATSVTSVSVNPPTLLVCVNQDNAGASIYEPGHPVAFHVLSAQQEHLSDRFAGRDGCTGPERFREIDWSADQSVPLLEGTSDVFVGTVDRMEPYQDHVMVGVTVDQVDNNNRAPLIYMASTYHQLQVDQDSAP